MFSRPLTGTDPIPQSYHKVEGKLGPLNEPRVLCIFVDTSDSLPRVDIKLLHTVRYIFQLTTLASEIQFHFENIFVGQLLEFHVKFSFILSCIYC